MKAMLEACLEKVEENLGEQKSIAEDQQVPNEEAVVDTGGTRGWIWGPASSRSVPPTAEETDPGRWWVPAEVGRRPRTVDWPCRYCTVQGTWQDTRQRHQRTK
jgi:hypothetical protein